MRKTTNMSRFSKGLSVLLLAGASLSAMADRRGRTVVVDLEDRNQCMRSRSDREEVDCFRHITDPRNADRDEGGRGSSCVTVTLCVDKQTDVTVSSNFLNVGNPRTISHSSCPAHLDGAILVGSDRGEESVSRESLPFNLGLRGNVTSFQKLSGRESLEGSVENGVLRVSIRDGRDGAGVYSFNVCTSR